MKLKVKYLNLDRPDNFYSFYDQPTDTKDFIRKRLAQEVQLLSKEEFENFAFLEQLKKKKILN